MKAVAWEKVMNNDVTSDTSLGRKHAEECSRQWLWQALRIPHDVAVRRVIINAELTSGTSFPGNHLSRRRDSPWT